MLAANLVLKLNRMVESGDDEYAGNAANEEADFLKVGNQMGMPNGCVRFHWYTL